MLSLDRANVTWPLTILHIAAIHSSARPDPPLSSTSFVIFQGLLVVSLTEAYFAIDSSSSAAMAGMDALAGALTLYAVRTIITVPTLEWVGGRLVCGRFHRCVVYPTKTYCSASCDASKCGLRGKTFRRKFTIAASTTVLGGGMDDTTVVSEP